MNFKTKLTKIGREPKKNKGFLNPGIYKGSTIIFDDYKSYFNDINRKTDASALYGINNNPLIEKLEKSLSYLYKAHDTVIAPSGLAAVIIPFFAFLNKNDEVLINDTLYSPTRSYCEKILKKLGIKIKYFHPTKNIHKFEKLITKQTKLIFLESPGTATFDIIDIPLITKIAKKYKIITVCDNSWSTPLFCQPTKLGINIIIDAGTKYISGHGDVLLGCISSDKKHANFIRKTIKTLGICPGSEEAYLTLRGLPTLFIRMKEIEKNAIKLSKYLNEHPKVSKVFHPALPDFYNHYIWKRDFSGSSGLFSFTLDKEYSNRKIEKFCKKLKIFQIGYSWGSFESLITFPSLKERHFKIKIKGNLVRIYCGLEDSKDQINDIERALKSL